MALSPYLRISDITADYLKANYLTGFTFTGADGRELPASFFEGKLSDAVAKLADWTNVNVIHEDIKSEKHDYRVGDYAQYAFLQLFRWPVQRVQEVRAVYPTGQIIQVFPQPWVRLNIEHGQIHLVPTSGTLSQVLIGQGGDYLPIIFGGLSYLPQLWEVDYTTGFDDEKIPRNIADALCKLASIEILQIMADILYPVGVQSQSLSADGLSQSRSYAIPAFKARIDAYKADLGLPGQPGQPGLVPQAQLSQIRNSYSGINLTVL